MSRRGSTQGTIHRRKDGRWVAAISLGYAGGRRRRKYLYAKTRQAVASKLATAIKTRQDGLPLPSERETLRVFLREWLTTVEPSLRPKTHRTYSDLVRLHVEPSLGAVRLARLEPRHLQQLYSDLAQRLSPMSIRHVHAVLRRSLRDAVRWGAVARNVAELVSPPRVATREMETLSPEQARALLDAADDDRLGALYSLALSTGMRQGELLALRWENLDLDVGRLQVRGTLQRVDGELVVLEPKTAASRRQITLANGTVAALRRHRAKQAEERLRLDSAWGEDSFVFVNEAGRPIDARNLVRSSFQPLLRRAGLPTLRFHDLRHSAATLMLSKGIHPKIVAETLGHARVGITLDVYSHVTPTMQHEAAAIMDSVLTRS